MILSALLCLLTTVAFCSTADERLRVSNAAVTSKLNELNSRSPPEAVLNRRRLFGAIYPWGNIDNSCGNNGNNYGRELLRKMAYSACLCAEACEKNDQCAGWTYIPVNVFASMGLNDCVLRSTWGGMVDNCGGRCRSGRRANAVCTAADCNNNAVSVSGNRGTGCQCTCKPGFGGDRCERAARCACENGGTAATGAECVKDGFHCASGSCPAGRSGKLCDLEYTDPAPTPCANGGEYCYCTGKAYHAERCHHSSFWWEACREASFGEIEHHGPNRGTFYAEKPVTGGIWCKLDAFDLAIDGWTSTDKRCWCDEPLGLRSVVDEVPISMCGAEVDQNTVIGQVMRNKYGISEIGSCADAASYCESFQVQSLCKYTCGRCKAAPSLDLENPLNNFGMDWGFGAGSGFFG